MWYVITILGLASITNLLVHSEPTMRLRNFLLRNHSGFFRRLLECALCTGFWIGLAFTFNIYLAAIISVVAEFISRKLNSGL